MGADISAIIAIHVMDQIDDIVITVLQFKLIFINIVHNTIVALPEGKIVELLQIVNDYDLYIQ